MAREPSVELDEVYSEPGAVAVPWSKAEAELSGAGIYWISTIRSGAIPHVTPIAGTWADGALYFPTGPGEQKAKNLVRNSNCTIATGCNAFDRGMDVVIEGAGTITSDETLLTRAAGAFAAKYGDFFGFKVKDGQFVHGDGSIADLYAVVPLKAFAYSRGPYTATRYRF